ncbi:MAG: class I SAM-dependent methyltransferase [Halovenus sp.]
MSGGDTFDKEMHDVDWTAMYERQAARSGDLTGRFCDLLGLEAGDNVLELGSGPGYTTSKLVENVSPGNVYAIDRHPGALRHLRETVEQQTARTHAVCGDVTALPVRSTEPIPTIAAFVLHHLTAPEAAIDAIRSALPPRSPFLVAEYRPEAAGEVGPPLDHRLASAQIREWLRDAGFVLTESVSLPEEKYALVSRRSDGT